MSEYLAGSATETESAGGESTTTVIIAFFANLGIAVAKTIVALITGSASMLAESAHSWADTGNQVVTRVAYLRLEFVGPRQVLLVASVDFIGEQPESRVAYTLRDVEARLEEDPNIAEALLTLATPDQPSI